MIKLFFGRAGNYDLPQDRREIKKISSASTTSSASSASTQSIAQESPKQVNSPTQYLMTGQRLLSTDKHPPRSIEDIKQHGELIGRGQEGEVYKWSSGHKEQDRALKIITYSNPATGQPYASSMPAWNAQCWNSFYSKHEDAGIRHYATARALPLTDGKIVLDTPFLKKERRDPYGTEYAKVEKDLKKSNLKIPGSDLYVPGNVSIVRSPTTNKEHAVLVDFGRAEKRAGTSSTPSN